MRPGGREAALRVGLAAKGFHPAYAGPGIRFRRYAPGLAARGIRFHVLTAGWPGSGCRVADRPPEGKRLPPETVDGLPVDRVWVERPGSRRRLYSAFHGALPTWCRETEVSVLQMLDLSPWSVPGLRGVRRAGVPVVYTETMLRDPEVASWKNRIWGFAFRFVDCVVVSTGVMRDSLRDAGIGGRIEIIPNGLDTERFRPARAGEKVALRERLGLPGDAEIVIFLGGFLSRRKGIDVLADAWGPVASARRTAHLILVGPHLNEVKPEGRQVEFLARVREALERSGASDRVHFTGRVDNVEEWLRASDVFVFPSRREGMPNVVPEAFGTGLASVVTPFLGLPEEFGRAGREYVLAERTPDALAEAVTELLADPRRRQRLGNAAREWVLQELDVERSLDHYADLYRELARNAPRGNRITETEHT